MNYITKREKYFKLNLIILLVFSGLLSCSHKQVKEEKIKPIKSVEINKSFYKTDIKKDWIKNAIAKSNCVTLNKVFQKEVSLIESFNHTTDNGKQVVKNLLKPDVMNVELFKYWNPFSKMIARREGNRIRFNSNKSPQKQSITKVVETLIHERLHLWYSHDGNYKNAYNLKTVPYLVAAIATKYVEGCK